MAAARDKGSQQSMWVTTAELPRGGNSNGHPFCVPIVDETEPLVLGIADSYSELAPASETAVVFRDSAFADDLAKGNLAAILE